MIRIDPAKAEKIRSLLLSVVRPLDSAISGLQQSSSPQQLLFWDDPSLIISPSPNRPWLRPLPRKTPGTAIFPPPQQGSRTSLLPTEWHSLTVAVGYLSWLQMVLPLLGVLRIFLDRLARSGTWSVDAAVAYDTLVTLLPWLHEWSRPVSPRGLPLISVPDAGGTGWGTVLTAPSGAVSYHAGTFSATEQALSSTYREALGCTNSIQVALDRDVPFGWVAAEGDSQPLRGSLAGRVRALDVARALLRMVVWSMQGLWITFRWRPRGELGSSDALSGAAGHRPWPLKPPILSWIWDKVGGWDVDMAAEESTTTAPLYATPGTSHIPSSVRRSALLGLASDMTDSPPLSGWCGLTPSVRLHETQCGFILPLWDELPAIANRLDDPCLRDSQVILIGPHLPAEWWGPSLARLQAASTESWLLPEAATIPPRPGAPRDPRRLRAYWVNPSQRPRPPRRRPIPAWWVPSRLTADGDIESEPGPMEDLFANGGDPPTTHREPLTTPPAGTTASGMESLFAITAPTRTPTPLTPPPPRRRPTPVTTTGQDHASKE